MEFLRLLKPILMEVCHDIDIIRARKRHSLVTIGNFDGVHRGHQALLSQLTAHSRRSGFRSIVISFANHPRAFFSPTSAPPLICDLPERIRLLEQAGVESLLLLPFDESVADMPAEEFVRDLLVERLQMAGIWSSPGFRFGQGQEGNIELLRRLGKVLSFGVHIIHAVLSGNVRISSTWIRELVLAGDLRQASDCLGRAFAVSGIVEKGEQLGHRLGFPTANLDVRGRLLPPPGIYATRTSIGTHIFPSISYLGTKPTLSQTGTLVFETHILEEVNLPYGERIRVSFTDFIRSDRVFRDTVELREQIAADIIRAQMILAAGETPGMVREEES